LRAETPEGERVESTAVIGSHEWAGFGAIEVTAVLQSGKRIQGVLQGAGAEILVPKRSHGDYIAESWRIAKGVAGVDASADYENTPIGDGNAGDGLTLYEEYRGFIENGQHIEGDPKKKDFMILNDAGSGYLAGIRRFAEVSELATHWKFQRSEWQDSNVVNLNFARGPHAVAQRGARVQASATHAGYAEADGRTVYIAPLDGTEDQKMFDYMNSSLTHELMHTVNVYHHGTKWSRWRVGQILATLRTCLKFVSTRTAIPSGKPGPFACCGKPGNPYRAGSLKEDWWYASACRTGSTQATTTASCVTTRLGPTCHCRTPTYGTAPRMNRRARCCAARRSVQASTKWAGSRNHAMATRTPAAATVFTRSLSTTQ
jgi:hypothetical protein